MTTHDLFTLQSVKAIEYLIALGYLVLFIPFWRFVSAAPAAERAVAPAGPGWLGQMAGWFRVPDHVLFHPGHAWAYAADGDVVTVGLDDFAQKLVGRGAAIRLPAIGSRLAQGERAWTLAAGSKSVDMLAPVDGTVVALNERALASPDLVEQDPYGEGWLLKVRAPRLGANVRQLLSGRLARRWMEEATEGLQGLMSPELGRLCQDGGVPVDGMARSLDPVRWDDIARRFLLS
jgi:glycine cleavage system H lipoate-binding protein